MTKCAPAWRLVLFLCMAFSLLGCSQFKRSSLEDEKDPHFLEGKKRATAFDWDGAIQSFERALQSNPNNASAHRELGIIYDTRKNDYGAAIYHYQRYLKLRPDSPMADVINQSVIACKRELAKTVSFAILNRDVQRDLERLSHTNLLLQQRVQLLETELARRPQYVTNYLTNFVAMPQFDPRSSARITQPAQLVTPEPEREEPVKPSPAPRVQQQARGSAPSVTANNKKAATQPAANQRKVSTVHTVRPGETMAVLAQKYGVSLAELKAANPSMARGVRAGQKVVIPAR